MEDELLKRNTDCVYFLASPFTCNKGAECEYRHSDMARLNPRDCWYWLSGNCLNPTCAFRHPPLEVHSGASTEAAASMPNQASVPATKTTVPCYFYYNGFCGKGDRCPFLHEPDDTFSSKPKMANAIPDAPVAPYDNKTSGKTDAGRTPAEKHPSLSEMAVMSGYRLPVQLQQQARLPAANNNILEQNTSAKIDVPIYEETAAVMQPAEGSPKSECEPSLGSDQSSEELIDGSIVRDEWWESSPGFDVLVDGQTEDTAYEDDPEYLHALDGNDGNREHLFMQHGFVDQTDYDERGFFDCGVDELSEHLDDELRTELQKYSTRHNRERKVRRVVEHKRKFFSMESPGSGGNYVDLRDYLRKRRMLDGYLKRHALSHDMVHRDDRKERLQRHVPTRRLHRRIASMVERNGVPLARRRTSVIDAEHRTRPRNSQRNSYRRYNGMRKHQSSTEHQPKSFSKRERYAQDSTAFDGPKSLAKIKEDRKPGHSSRNGLVDFEGPKPLSEILKDKKKTTSFKDGTTSSSN